MPLGWTRALSGRLLWTLSPTLRSLGAGPRAGTGGTGAATAGIAARTAPAIPSGEGPSPAVTTALIAPKSAQFAERMAQYEQFFR
jgi:hypothetical protein